MIKNTRIGLLLILVSFFLGIFTDILLRQEIFGINFFMWSLLWVSIIVVASLIKRNLTVILMVHLVIIIINGLMTYLRSEPIVQIWSVLIVLALLANCFQRVHIIEFNNLSYFSKIVEWASNSFIAIFRTLSWFGSGNKSDHKKPRLKIGPGVFAGLALGFIFIGLFSSSDVIFRDSFSWIGNIFSVIGDFLSQYNFGRLFTVVFWVAVAFAWLVVLFTIRHKPFTTDIALPKFLLPKDIKAVYLIVIPIFCFYSFLQARFLFANTNLPDGLTYASYARRGYGELLLATFIASALVYYTVVFAKKHSEKVRWYSYILLILNTFVVFSAWKRLSLYEDAYGWTMTRFIARIGLICVLFGCLTLILWVSKRIKTRRLYALNGYAVIAILTTVSIVNPVGLITKHNILDLPKREVPLDTIHILTQSPDSYQAICSTAGTLINDYKDDYAVLKKRTVVEDGYLYDYAYKTIPVSMLSNHYVFTDAFKSKYHNCLP